MAAVDTYGQEVGAMVSRAADGAAVTPSDSVPLAFVTLYLFVGGAGNVTVITAAGNTLTITGVTAGTLIPLRVSQVKATGTTATSIVALY